MKINSEYSASLILARCRETPGGNHRWHLRFDESLNPDIIIAARLQPGNEDILNYHLIPRADILRERLNLKPHSDREVSVRDRPRQAEHPGFLALHVAIDDYSRMAFTQMLPDQKAETTIGFLNSAVEFFARHGIGVRALLTDNGSSYRSRQFRHACLTMNIKHSRTRPYTPRTNGKAERFIQTVLREWAYAKHWPDSEQRESHLQPWNHYYNHQRPHGSLNYKPPISRSDPGTTS